MSLSRRALSSLVCAAAIAACAPAPRAPGRAAPQESRAAPAAVPAAPAPVAPPASATEVMARSRAPFDACFTRARDAHPDLHRMTVEITFGLDDAGKPSTVDLQYRRRVDDAVKDCMRSAAFATQFPPALRGRQTGTIELGAP